MSKNQIILGIDPGSNNTGYGIIERSSSGRLYHGAHGTIKLAKHKTAHERIKDLAKDMLTLLDKYRPHIAVIEDVFFFKHAQAALILGQARGAILATLGQKDIPTHALLPTQVKSLITGQGRAKKFQVAQIVALELGIETPTSSDASDALAIALAFALKAKHSLKAITY